MPEFIDILRRNRQYRTLWIGQVVSEIGDHFNTIAVFSLAMDKMGSGAVVAGTLIWRAIAAMIAGPLAGLVLDRFDRRTVMIVSDLWRAAVSLAFIALVYYPRSDLLYLLSALLMLASPFFSAGRSAILPALAPERDLHTASAVTQTTQWTNTAIGTMLGGTLVAGFGFEAAFIANACSFLVSAVCIYLLEPMYGSFKAVRQSKRVEPLRELREGIGYMRRNPLILGIATVSMGWATGGGAAQVLFGLLGHSEFGRGPRGIGELWGAAGVGLVIGGIVGHRMSKVLDFNNYKRAIAICYVFHGGFYVLMALTPHIGLALLFIAISRMATAISSVMNTVQLLKNVDQAYRGRVFSSIETVQWTIMLMSMAAAGWATEFYTARQIAVVAGILSTSTAAVWAYLNVTGRLPQPKASRRGVTGETVIAG